ncbi:hypothetical protein DPEC_G00162360 [Dallia pectoralis]|uniref:Uncharacterized protein n=1 Tax=Dallia pectoralis TaxID=75939 RepID=A0ACC2GGU9_DALPE|nr:hypothetical protein DPEC_G00162360 [Dallia pectoralis]
MPGQVSTSRLSSDSPGPCPHGPDTSARSAGIAGIVPPVRPRSCNSSGSAVVEEERRIDKRPPPTLCWCSGPCSSCLTPRGVSRPSTQLTQPQIRGLTKHLTSTLPLVRVDLRVRLERHHATSLRGGSPPQQSLKASYITSPPLLSSAHASECDCHEVAAGKGTEGPSECRRGGDVAPSHPERSNPTPRGQWDCSPKIVPSFTEASCLYPGDAIFLACYQKGIPAAIYLHTENLCICIGADTQGRLSRGSSLSTCRRRRRRRRLFSRAVELWFSS